MQAEPLFLNMNLDELRGQVHLSSMLLWLYYALCFGFAFGGPILNSVSIMEWFMEA